MRGCHCRYRHRTNAAKSHQRIGSNYSRCS
jgi:hypothetical protein